MLQSQAIDFDAQGNFEVLVSREAPAGTRNWLKIEPDCVGLLIRVVYHERAKETAPVMRIERLDHPAPQPLRADHLSTQLAKSGQLVLAYLELVRSWWQDKLSQRPNSIRFSRALYLSNGGVPDRHHGFGTWKKAPGEALLLHFTPPPCDYWIFQLCNLWQENLDNYEDGQGFVTKYRCAHRAGRLGLGGDRRHRPRDRRQLGRSGRTRARRHEPAADPDPGAAADRCPPTCCRWRGCAPRDAPRSAARRGSRAARSPISRPAPGSLVIPD